MANRDAKEWLESVTLDEDDMISDSATDVASQQSIKKYVDDSVDGLATETYVDNAVLGLGQVSLSVVAAGSSYSPAFGAIHAITDNDIDETTFTLPEITSGDTGKRIRIMAQDGGAGIRLTAYTGQQINGYTSIFETTAPEGTYHLVAVYDVTTPYWIMTR